MISGWHCTIVQFQPTVRSIQDLGKVKVSRKFKLRNIRIAHRRVLHHTQCIRIVNQVPVRVLQYHVQQWAVIQEAALVQSGNDSGFTAVLYIPCMEPCVSWADWNTATTITITRVTDHTHTHNPSTQHHEQMQSDLPHFQHNPLKRDFFCWNKYQFKSL